MRPSEKIDELTRICFHLINKCNRLELELKAAKRRPNSKHPSGLSRQHRQIVRLLVEAYPRTLSKFYIYENIYQRDHAKDTDTKAMEVRISQIRKRIGKDKIQNVHGVGYRIPPEAIAELRELVKTFEDCQEADDAATR